MYGQSLVNTTLFSDNEKQLSNNLAHIQIQQFQTASDCYNGSMAITSTFKHDQNDCKSSFDQLYIIERDLSPMKS